jgi:hypothetical protein
MSAEYEALRILVSPAVMHEKENQNFRASVFSGGVVVMLEVVTRLAMVSQVGRRWLWSFAHFASGQIPLLPLAASATVCL